MNSPSIATVHVLKLTSNEGEKKSFSSDATEDQLAVEQPLEIRIIFGSDGNRQQKNISVTMCTPGHDEELATGFLFTEGIISGRKDIRKSFSPAENIIIVELEPGIQFDPQKIERHFYTSSSCGVCGKSSIEAVRNTFSKTDIEDSIQIDAAAITTLPDILRKHQQVFEYTGGLHASALFALDATLLSTREDVGRHNALDKLIGAALIAGDLPLADKILLLSGRASFELIQKAAMAGIKVVCAVGAPSSLAVDLAKECNITLVGFLRNGRFNVYCGESRIIGV